MNAIWMVSLVLGALAIYAWYELRKARSLRLKSNPSHADLLAFGRVICQEVSDHQHEAPVAESIIGAVCAAITVKSGDPLVAVELLEKSAAALRKHQDRARQNLAGGRR